MNKKLLSLLITATIGLSACGGGGTDSRSISTGSSSTSSGGSGSSSSSSGSSTTTTTSTNSAMSGKGYSWSWDKTKDVNADDTSNYDSPSSAAEVNVLKVEGRAIQLLTDSELGTKDWIQKDAPTYTGSGNAANPSWLVVGNQLNHAKFGEMYDGYEKRYLFAQGMATSPDSLPTARADVTYKGHATYSPTMAYTEKPAYATSEFTVNFGEKTIIGAITPSSGDATLLKGVINSDDSSFEGVHVDSKNVIQGSFYGPNAEEMAGTYYGTIDGKMGEGSYDPNRPNGTFGATKQ